MFDRTTIDGVKPGEWHNRAFVYHEAEKDDDNRLYVMVGFNTSDGLHFFSAHKESWDELYHAVTVAFAKASDPSHQQSSREPSSTES